MMRRFFSSGSIATSSPVFRIVQICLCFLFLLNFSDGNKSSKDMKRCLGPPYLYISTHDEVQNILKFSRDGCLLSSKVVTSSSTHKAPSFIEFRSMVFGSYWDGERFHSNALYVADAVSYHSTIYIFSNCQPNNDNQRTLLNTVVTTMENPGADHTYGLAFGIDHRLYATFQHTDVVLSFVPQNTSRIALQPWVYRSGDFPPALQQPIQSIDNATSNSSPSVNDNRYNQPSHWYDFFPGTFYQFGNPRIQKRSAQGIRSILILHYCSDGSVIANNDNDPNNEGIADYHYDNAPKLRKKTIIRTMVWIANEDIDGILVVDQSTGLAQHILTVHNPIHLLFHGKTQQVFVSSKRKHWRGAVFAVNPHSLKIDSAYSTNQMDHPTGLAIYENILYVGMQERAQIIKFDVNTKKYLGVAIKHIPGEIEHLLLTPC